MNIVDQHILRGKVPMNHSTPFIITLNTYNLQTNDPKFDFYTSKFLLRKIFCLGNKELKMYDVVKRVKKMQRILFYRTKIR